jgi:hypothetical protein
MSPRVLGFGLAALLCCATGCSDPKVSMATGPREYTDSDYAQVLERWTRTKSLVAVSELDTLLTVTATFESWDFRWAYVALYGTNVRWTDLTRANSAWIVRLIDDEGNETAPLSIELISRPGPLEKRYFPYSTVWRNVFRIKFPTTTPGGQPTIAADARWFGLRFAGAEGNDELRWELGEPPKRTALR